MVKAFATLEDVAEAAGMSRAQTSRALRGDPGVKPETRERIAKIAEGLNYKPNLAARSLMSGHSSIVGLLIGNPNNPFHIQLAQSMDRALMQAGFECVTSLRLSEEGSVELEVDRLLRLRAAGVIMLANPLSVKALTSVADRLPCVYVGSRHLNHAAISVVTVDDESGVNQSLQHLYNLGHRRIAHLGGGSEASARQRTKAYCAFMENAGLEPFFIRGTHDATSGRRGVDLLFADPRPPTAILCSNDYLALGVLDRLRGMGLKVPDDVSVVGFDDIPTAANAIFSLSTVRQDTDVQARTAVDALKAIIAGHSKRIRRHIMPVELVVRESSGTPRPS